MNLSYLLLSHKPQRSFQSTIKACVSCTHYLKFVALHSLKAESQTLFFKAVFALLAPCSSTSQ